MKKKVLLSIIAIFFTFTISCISKEIPITETYYETEIKTEKYIENTTGENYLAPENKWYCEYLQISTQLPENEVLINCDTYGGAVFSGVWYLGYKLSKHTSSKVIVQTWERANKSFESVSPSNITLLSEYNNTKSEMISAYNVTTTGYIIKPPFDKPIYTIYHYIGPGGYDFKSRNVYPFEEKEFNEWLDQFNTRISEPNLGTQFSCDCPSYIRGCQYDEKSEYQFDVTGVNTLAIIIAGREYRSEKDLNQNSGYIFLPQQSSIDPSPVKSVKLVWSDEVAKQREISCQVEKQRTVMQTKQIPFWEFWKTYPPKE